MSYACLRSRVYDVTLRLRPGVKRRLEGDKEILSRELHFGKILRSRTSNLPLTSICKMAGKLVRKLGDYIEIRFFINILL